jgi:hypothetical protein
MPMVLSSCEEQERERYPSFLSENLESLYAFTEDEGYCVLRSPSRPVRIDMSVLCYEGTTALYGLDSTTLETWGNEVDLVNLIVPLEPVAKGTSTGRLVALPTPPWP